MGSDHETDMRANHSSLVNEKPHCFPTSKYIWEDITQQSAVYRVKNAALNVRAVYFLLQSSVVEKLEKEL